MIPALIGGGASIAGSFLSGKPKTSTSTTTPTFSPEMQSLMDRLSEFSSSSMTNPMATFDPMRAPAIDKINKSYDMMPQQVATQMSRRGYGSSGEMGNSQYKIAMARGGAMNDLESQLLAMGADRQNQGAAVGENLLSLNRGSTSTGTTPDTSLSNGLMSAGNAGSNLSTLLMLSKVLKG